MTAILDTSFLFALTDQSDRNHQRVLSYAQNSSEKLVLPTVVLPEICYLISSRLGHPAMRHFFAPSIGEIFRSSVLNIVTISRYFLKLLILIEMYGVKDVERELMGFDGGEG